MPATTRSKIVAVLVAVVAMVVGLLVSASTANAVAPVVFVDGGTSAPASTLGGNPMTAFGADPQPTGTNVSSVASPLAGSVSFSPSLDHETVPAGWSTWSNGYTGDVYTTGGNSVTLTLPSGTNAFYLYAEPDNFGTYQLTATTDNGTTSGAESVDGSSGARNFGFYTTDGSAIATITITADAGADGFAVGEFGINSGPLAAPVPNKAPASDGLLSGVNIITPQGSTVSWSGSGFAPYAPVTFAIYNAQTYKKQFTLGPVTADASGAATYNGPVPYTTGIKYVAAIGYKSNGKVLDLTGQTRFM